MLEAVFWELSNFLAYLLIVMCAFGLVFKVVFDDPSPDSIGAGPISFMIMAFRVVWGEGSFDIEKTEFKSIAWISYMLLMLIGNVILLNFLIASVNESYVQTNQKIY